MTMKRPIRPTLSPAEERRHVEDLGRREMQLENEAQAASALLEFLDAGGLSREAPPMTPRNIQAMFPEASDRAIKNGVLGRVLLAVGVQAQNTRVQPWQVVDAEEKLDKHIMQLRLDLANTRWHQGKLSYELWKAAQLAHTPPEEGTSQEPAASQEAGEDGSKGHGDCF